ncbi:MAG: hypothetical protein QW343_00790 [Candidatus Norongarragalinales archaeon]
MALRKPLFVVTPVQLASLNRAGVKFGGGAAGKFAVPRAVIAPPAVLENLRRKKLAAALRSGSVALLKPSALEQVKRFAKKNWVFIIADLIPYVGKPYVIAQASKWFASTEALLKQVAVSAARQQPAEFAAWVSPRAQAVAAEGVKRALALRQEQLRRVARVLNVKGKQYLLVRVNPRVVAKISRSRGVVRAA